MNATALGSVKSPKGRVFEVKWDARSRDLYVSGKRIGKAKDEIEAMQKARAWVSDK